MPRGTTKSATAGDAAEAEPSANLAGDSPVRAMLEAGNAAAQGALSCGRLIIESVNASVRESFEASQRLMNCTDPREAFAIQCELARAVNRRVLEDTTKLLNLAAETSHACWPEFTR